MLMTNTYSYLKDKVNVTSCYLKHTNFVLKTSIRNQFPTRTPPQVLFFLTRSAGHEANSLKKCS